MLSEPFKVTVPSRTAVDYLDQIANSVHRSVRGLIKL
jgi:hypothetical protein